MILLRERGIEVRPSWLPFTPWTTIDDLIDLMDFVIAHDLIPNVDPVQFTVRLLLPEGSLLLDQPATAPHLGPYDPLRLGWTWSHPDDAIDQLQQNLAALVEARIDQAAAVTFAEIDVFIRSRAEPGRARPPTAGLHPRVRPAPGPASGILVLLQRADRRAAGTTDTPRLTPDVTVDVS